MIKTLYILFSITLLISIATTTFAAELGAGKALKADKGPTLEQTTDFIKSKFNEFYIDHIVWGVMGSPSHEYTRKADISISGCNVVVLKESEHTSGKGWSSVSNTKFNLEDISTVEAKIDDGSGAYTSVTTGNGMPLYYVRLVAKQEKIFSSGVSDSKQFSGSGKEEWINVKNQEYAKRLVNAFERAVQLCGGGKDIGKEELF